MAMMRPAISEESRTSRIASRVLWYSAESRVLKLRGLISCTWGGVGAGVGLSLQPARPAANARPTAREAERRRRTGRG